MTRVFVVASLAAAVGCATTGTHSSSPESASGTVRPAAHEMDQSIWFAGTVEKAFETAKQQNKPIFLYWGAVWCPPCNEIKSQVFSTSDFADLMQAVVPVYLDGDTERAQEWGEKLHVTGYPTLLVLDPSGREIMRIGEFVDLEEFTAAFKSALAAARPLKETIERALSGKGTEEDWNILAYASWDGTADDDLQTRLKLVQAVPQEFVVQRAVLAARLLESASGTPRDSEAGKAIRADSKKLLDAIFFFDGCVFAARSTIVSMSKEIVSWLYPEASAERTALIEKWLKAADWLQSHPGASVSDRLLAMAPQVELWQLEHGHGKEPLPHMVKEDVRTAVAHADHDATTPYLRHAIISDAAQLLGEAGDLAGARALLEKELKTTDTPWYYQSELAELEMKAGHEEAALAWSEKARTSAKGNATRIQWIALDLKMNLHSSKADKWTRCAALWQQLFDAALALPDGLSGRNAKRTQAAFDAMRGAHPSEADLKPIAAAYDDFIGRCSKAQAAKGQPAAACYRFVGAQDSATFASALSAP